MKLSKLPIGIHSSDVVGILRDEGYDVGIWRLRAAATNGRIPKPIKAKAGDHLWRADDIPAICRYFDNPIKPGRPKNESPS
jgi:hypothetical protein|tara:strand:+ start:555 stop:797 length:243 start_codon:yes stop_codon:yes gene_type:complete